MTATAPAPVARNSAGPRLLECASISMAFSGVPVLREISFGLEPGTVTALAGENGAGKSTLMKIVSGQYHPDAGTVRVDGEVLAGGSAEAVRRGVAIVPQELASIPDMTVYENLFIGRELRRAGVLNRRAMAARAQELLEEFGVELNPRTRMGDLAVSLRQVIEIARATSTGARVLLLDEPTSSISEREVERLYDVVTRLRRTGVAVLFTTHKMAEIRAMADRVVVLRDGTLTVDRPIAQITDDEIVEGMIGRELGDLYPAVAPATSAQALVVRGLGVDARPPIDLTVRAGEIVGLAGLVGAGRTELLETIFGVRRARGGAVEIHGRRLRRHDVSASILSGMALVPEDRKGAGVILGMSIVDNGTLPRLDLFSRAGWLRETHRRRRLTEIMDRLGLRRRSLRQSVETLSGGNQQKVVVGRWLTGEVKVLLLDEPTRGVDVGARNEIYRIITKLAAQGMAVLMASSDLPEVLALAHRAYVMRAGTFVAELDATALSSPEAQDRIFRLASGQDATEE